MLSSWVRVLTAPKTPQAGAVTDAPVIQRVGDGVQMFPGRLARVPAETVPLLVIYFLEQG